MKRIIVCMDGTWQNLNQDKLTNIGVLARSIAHKETVTNPETGAKDYIHQIVIYTHGVGSSIGALTKRSFLEEASASFNRLAGGAFGEGLEDGIVDTYLRLAFNYEYGDEIYIFGFSRGAFAARRLAACINMSGIVSRRHVDKARDAFRLYYDSPLDTDSDAKKQEYAEATKQFRMLYGKGRRNPDGSRLATDDHPPIKYLGVFDTVAQRGAADVIAGFTPWGNSYRYKFKNYRIATNVENARHACAMDENRLGFPVLLWDNVEEANRAAGRDAYGQKWFVGTHGDVGGGEGSKLAAAALKWIAEGAAQVGLRFYAKHGDDTSPLDDALRDEGLCFDGNISRPRWDQAINPMNYSWRPRKIWTRKEKPSVQDLQHYFDGTVFQRFGADHVRPRYRPEQLRPFQKAMKDYDPRLK